MTKTNTRSRIVSILLVLVMLLSLLPTTALAASPDASNVYVNGGINFYNSTRLYYRNGDSASSFSGTPTDYNAAYAPSTGTLTLKDYNGKGITVGGVGRTDITVVLIGTNTINGSLTNDVGGDITITSESGGTLSITNTLSGGNDAIGIETGLSASYTTGNVAITGDAKVTINMTNNATSTYERAYGIYAKENITISESASVDITCATPYNTTGGGNCNGLRAEKNVIIETNGTIKIDVTKAGKDDGYSFGVYPMGTAILTKVGEMEVQWKKHATHSSYPGGAVYKGASLSDTDYAINVDTTNCYASYRKGTPYTVRVENGDLTGPGVPNKMGSGMFLVNDTVNITPYEKKSNDEMLIPFQKWTSSDVEITNPTSPSNSFTVPGKNVTVTAMHSPFVGAPVFKRTDDSKGTIAFQTAVKPDGSAEYFEYVKVGKENDPYGYRSIAPQPITASTASPYEYSVSASNYYTGGDIKNLEAGDYRMAVTLNGERYLSEKFTVNYTAPVTTYTVSFNANGGTGTMANVTGVSGEYMLPANGFTAPAGKQFKGWATSAYGSVISGTTYEVSSDTTFYAIWESKEYSITVTDGKATIGAGSEISKAAEGTAVTLTANAAPTGKVFDKWEVVSGGITLADANSATTTFTMPASTVSVKATYKNAPHTHTYNQETVKPEALKTPADCTHNAVYFKSCSCGAISTTDTFVAMNTALGHAYGSDWKYDSTNHWHECSRCHDKKDEAAHSASEWIIDTAATETAEGAKHKECTVCKKVLETATIPATGSSHTHSYGTDWKYDDTNHWHECECSDKADIAAHSASEWIIDTAATETAEGAKHKECTVCKKVLETATIPATGSSHTHSYGTDWKYDDTNHWHECECSDKADIAAHSASEWIIDTAATETAEGAKHKECTVCKKVLETATIPATSSSDTPSYGVYVGMTYTAGNLIYQITSIDTATVGQSKVIGVVAAKKNKIKKVTIPDRADCKGYRLNVTTIGNNAFAGCKALKKLTIGNKVTVIGKNAFKKCSKLETVVIGKAVKTISSKAFIGDNKIKKITFKGKKLKTVNKNAFSKKAKKNIKSKKTKLKGNKKAIKLFKKKLKIK